MSCAAPAASSRQAGASAGLPLPSAERNVPEGSRRTALLAGSIWKERAATRVKLMLQELRQIQESSVSTEKTRVKEFTRELEELKASTERLFEAVEKGLLPLDDTLKERSQKLKNRREELLKEISAVQSAPRFPLADITSAEIRAFSEVFKKKLLETENGFGKEYLRLLVDEIRCDGQEAQITGGYGKLANAMAQTKMGTPVGVPRFVPVWLAGSDKSGHWSLLVPIN